MSLRLNRPIFAAALCLLSVASAGAQVRPEQGTLMAERVFKNVQALKGIPVNEFMATMGFISASLGETCTDCHINESASSWDRYADDTPRKLTTRKMIVMVSAINKTYFGGKREVTCYSCHRGGERPRVTPNLTDVYGPPHIDEPDELREETGNGNSAAQILDKYLQALGGAQKLGTLTSYAAKGMYKGYSDPEKRPVEIFAKAPDQRTTIVHSATGDITTTYSKGAGWVTAPTADSPVPVLELTEGDLDGAALDTHLTFPVRIKQALRQWRSGFPAIIDDQDVQLVQGTLDGKYPVNLYFDKAGLLVRVVRYTDSPIGLSPTQIDYSDYREVAGVKMPFRWTTTWLDGRSTTELSEVTPNAPIDAARFAKPAASKTVGR